VALARSFVVFVHVVRVGLIVVSLLTGGAFVCGLARVTLINFSSPIGHLAVQHCFELLVVVHFGLRLLDLSSHRHCCSSHGSYCQSRVVRPICFSFRMLLGLRASLSRFIPLISLVLARDVLF